MVLGKSKRPAVSLKLRENDDNILAFDNINGDDIVDKNVYDIL